MSYIYETSLILVLGVFIATAASACSDPCKNYAPCCSEVRKISCQDDGKCEDALGKLLANCESITPSSDQCEKSLSAINSGLGTVSGSGVDTTAAKSACAGN